MIKYLDRSKLEETEFTPITIPGYNPSSWGEDLEASLYSEEHREMNIELLP